jgi:hypothetical protein
VDQAQIAMKNSAGRPRPIVAYLQAAICSDVKRQLPKEAKRTLHGCELYATIQFHDSWCSEGRNAREDDQANPGKDQLIKVTD